jgi:hypothetical protein
MSLKTCASGVALLVLTMGLAGCNTEHAFEGLFAHYPDPGPLHYKGCGKDAHTESYPLAKDERHAYGCKSDNDGFLETSSQADRRRN